MLRCSCALVCLLISLAGCSKGSPQYIEKGGADEASISEEVLSDDSLMAGQGIMVGELTNHSAFVQVRLTKGDKLVERDLPGSAGVVKFTLSRDGKQIGEPVTVQATESFDFIARTAWTELTSGTTYLCETEIGPDADSLQPGPTASFKTLYGSEKSEPLRFVVVTGMNYAKFHGDDRIDLEQHKLENNRELPEAYSGPDKHLGYPALETILKKEPMFFVGTGDNVYYDTPDNPRAETVEELRQKWHEQFIQPRYVSLFAKVPTYWEVDDHDYRIDDGDNSGDYIPTPETARRMMIEQLPMAAHGDNDAKTYRTHRISKDLQVWFTEGRIHRSDNATPDGPEKTIWGTEQKEWLKKTLSESDATFKVLISPTPMIGPDDLRKTDNHTNVGGFQHERDEFFNWLTESGVAKQNFYLVCGDRHWQYHSIHPSGIEEFSCGALIDENSRPGRLPGDPKSTDPDATIKQPYSQREASGGFLEIQLSPKIDSQASTLTFLWNDEHGKVLHKEVKTDE